MLIDTGLSIMDFRVSNVERNDIYNNINNCIDNGRYRKYFVCPNQYVAKSMSYNVDDIPNIRIDYYSNKKLRNAVSLLYEVLTDIYVMSEEKILENKVDISIIVYLLIENAYKEYMNHYSYILNSYDYHKIDEINDRKEFRDDFLYFCQDIKKMLGFISSLKREKVNKDAINY